MNRQVISKVLSSIQAPLPAIFVFFSPGTGVKTSLSGIVDRSVRPIFQFPRPFTTRCSPLSSAILNKHQPLSNSNEILLIFKSLSAILKLLPFIFAASSEMGLPGVSGSARVVSFFLHLNRYFFIRRHTGRLDCW